MFGIGSDVCLRVYVSATHLMSSHKPLASGNTLDYDVVKGE